ncbi:radical sam protein, putative [Entamoeba invadens IP1]|uniref:radical sam protein, putative n=1 Tax=Entamoeba invadens IP1 TaxID=370355 RepID=UPI0002C3E309|nr:radical sam protein, putative [Entamoeba invadens IP1]ELP93138.1 radical sam protein, putative [Entamoeba invadens IP1]|eukprot:XP_004259909.1 radical sam protein, putative [Entamoeba invadens IP1]
MSDIEELAHKKVKFYTFGCSHNVSDSEVMQKDLTEAGYILDKADSPLEGNYTAVVVNSCTVKNPSQQSIEQIKKKCEEMHIPVVLAGCVPQADPKVFKCSKNCSIVGVDQLHKIKDAVESAVRGEGATYLERGPLVDIDSYEKSSPLIDIIVTCTGCENACTYCKTKHARGGLRSYPIIDIIKRIKKSINEGVKELRLTGEDIGAYGMDIGDTFPHMLKEMCDVVEGKAMIRIGMVNPPYIIKYFDEIVEVFKRKCVYKFIHIPIQSGSTQVLEAMKRKYTREEFDDVCARLRKCIPEITIATDIICGFPTETDEDHKMTLDCLKVHQFPIVNISQMCIRPGTPAAQMKPVNSKVKKQRSREVTEYFDSYFPYKNMVGKTCQVWINEMAHDKQNYAAHDISFVQVILAPQKNVDLFGKSAIVKIVEAGKFFVKGEFVSLAE